MIEAPVLLPDTGSLSAALVRRTRPAAIVRSPSRALIVLPPAPAAADWAADLRFFAICYLAGFIFFLVMLS